MAPNLSGRTFHFAAMIAVVLFSSLPAGGELKEIAVVDGHKTALRSLQFTPDGSKVVATCFHSVRIWDTQSHKPIHVVDKSDLEGMHAFCGSAVSPDGKQIAAGFLNRAKEAGLFFLDPCGGTKPRRISLKISRKDVFDMFLDMNPQVYSPDGKAVIVFSRERRRDNFQTDTLRAWNVETGQQTVLFSGRNAGMLGDQRITAVAIDSRRLMLHNNQWLLHQIGRGVVARGRDYLGSNLTILDLTTGGKTPLPIPKLDGHYFFKPHVRYSRSGNVCAVVNDGGSQILLWRFGTQERIDVVKTDLRVRDLQISADGKYLAAVSANIGPKFKGRLTVVELATGNIVADAREQKDVLSANPLVAFSPDGTRLAVGGYAHGKIKFYRFGR